MDIQLFANSINFGSVDVKIIDISMGVIGGQLRASDYYFEQLQPIFRSHIQQSNWDKISSLDLKANVPLFGELDAEGGICITDVEDFSEIEIEICGIDSQVLNRLFV